MKTPAIFQCNLIAFKTESVYELFVFAGVQMLAVLAHKSIVFSSGKSKDSTSGHFLNTPEWKSLKPQSEKIPNKQL